jgi:hypothetical protein
MLRPEDWLTGGYEPSITFWGPLGAEYIAERLLDLMPLALTPMREDASSASATRVAVPTVDDGLDIDNPAPMAGTVPATVPPDVWARTGHPDQAQPPVAITRVSGIATFVWIGDDPQVQTPHVTLQYEGSPGVFTDVTRRSGRIVEDQELAIAYTPEPLQRSGPQTHVWVVEWQAVPWFGAPNVDSLDARGGVPLGTYRFHVEGGGGQPWTLDSNPFTVVQGGLAPIAVRAGTINIGVKWSAPKGWRLMDLVMMSNQPVPVRNQQVTVELMDAANTVLATSTPNTDASGNVSVADVATTTQVRVTDQFGNHTTVAIP